MITKEDSTLSTKQVNNPRWHETSEEVLKLLCAKHRQNLKQILDNPNYSRNKTLIS